MSIQEAESDIVRSPRPEHGEELRLSFTEAAEMSHGPYDTPEQCADRVEIARRLQAAMQPGASVLHHVGRLEVLGGILLEQPDVVALAKEHGGGMAIVYNMWHGSTEYTGVMPFRSLVYGARYGAPAHLPELAAGREGIASMVRRTFLSQRDREAAPGGVAWHDISPLTELYTYAALKDTDVCLTDVLPEVLVIGIQDRLLADLCDPAKRHLQPTLINGLFGTAPISPEDLFSVAHYHLDGADVGHRARVLAAIDAQL